VWKVVGIIVAVLLALSVIGLVIKALRFLLIVALVIAVVAGLAGAFARKEP